MTVSSTTRLVEYSTNGTNGPWGVGFAFFSPAHLEVTHTSAAGVATQLVLNVSFTVSGSNVFTTTAYEAGGTITIVRSIPFLQELDLRVGDEFPPESVEQALDLLTMIAQQIDESANRAIKVPEFGAAVTLPNSASRSEKMLQFDASGVPGVSAFTAGQVAAAVAAVSYAGITAGHISSVEKVAATAGQSLVTLSTVTYTPGTKSLLVFADGILLDQGDHYAETSPSSFTLTTALATDATIVAVVGRLVTSGAESSQVTFTPTAVAGATRTLTAKLDELPSLDDFSGATDHAKLTAAVTHANLTGRAIFIPPRTVNIDTSLGSITLEEVTLHGVGVGDGATATIDAGSNFSITGTTNSPFKIRRGTSIVGCGFYYPNITDTVTPTVHPPTLDFDTGASDIQFVNIRNNVVFNAYDFLKIGLTSGAVGHVWIENNTICALRRSIEIRRNLEVIRISGNTFTFGHWLAATEGNARAFYRANAVHVKYDEGDGLFVHSNLFFGALRTLEAGASGTCQLIEFIGNKVDQTRYGISATGVGNLTQLVVDGNTFYCANTQDTTLQGNAIRIATTGVVEEAIAIGVNAFVLATEDFIYVTGNNPSRLITVAPCQFYLWAAYKAAGTYGALNINGNSTSLAINGGWLRGSSYPARSAGILGSFNTLTCNGVTFQGCKQPLNVTVNTATGAGNVSYTTNDATSDQVTATTLCWGPNRFDKPYFKTPLVVPLGDMASYANDAAAAAAGVPIGGFYRNASAMNIRIA